MKNTVFLCLTMFVYNFCGASDPAASATAVASSAPQNDPAQLLAQLQAARKELNDAHSNGKHNTIRNKAWTKLYIRSLSTKQQATTKDLIAADSSGSTQKIVSLRDQIEGIETEMKAKSIPIPESAFPRRVIAEVVYTQESR